MGHWLKICTSIILSFVLILCIYPLSTSPASSWEDVLVEGIDEIPTDNNVLASVTASTFSFQLWHYSGGYWGNNQIRITDSEQFADAKYLESQIKEFYEFPIIDLPAEAKEAVKKGVKVRLVCKAPANMKLNDMFYFEKGKPEFRIVDNGQSLEFRAYPKLNFVDSDYFSYRNFVSGVKKMIPFAKPPYGKNVYSIWSKSGANLGMAVGFFDPNNPNKLGPEGTIHPSQIANSSGYLKPGFKVKVYNNGEKTYNSADVAIGSHTFQNAGAVGIQFDYPIILKFYIAEDDLVSQFETIPAAAPVGENTLVGVRVTSTFNQDVNTEYAWNITNAATGEVLQNITYQGHGAIDSETGLIKPSGPVTIPANGEKLFYAVFPMPDANVTVSFRINNAAGSNPKEIILVNNIATSVIKRGVGYYLPYNVLARDISHPLIQGEDITANLYLPRGSWIGNATGSLSVNKAAFPEVLSQYQVLNNPFVNEPSTHIIRNPVASAVINRTSVGDNPLGHSWLNLPDPYTPIKRNPSITYNGSVSREYKYYCDKDDCSGHYGTATAAFDSGTDILGVRIYSYNGKHPNNMPYVAARNFKKTVENNNNSQLKRNLFWVSTPYNLDVIRWMCNLDENGMEYGYRQVDGQYKRTFTQQDRAEITMINANPMANMYKYDRDNARAARNGKNYYPRVPFPTDRQLQNYAYPFKSGYYFNPAGQYKFKIKTVLYKNSTANTQEHINLVNKVINSFHYQSNMQYFIDGFKDKTFDLTAKNNKLNGVAMLKINKDYHKNYEELYHTTNSSMADETDRFFKEILEGYAESNTADSRTNFKYREYIKDGQHIYRVTEETEVTITVNPNNVKLYTNANMRDGNYLITAWLDDFTYNTNGSSVLNITGKKPLDQIIVTVKGSMFDDLNN